MHKNNNAVCSIICMNYIPYARCLRESLVKQNPNCKFYLFVLDGKGSDIAILRSEFNVVIPEDLGIRDFKQASFYYNLLELSTIVKPTLMKYLFEKYCFESVIYFDPDIYIYQNIALIYDLLEKYQIVLTPHITNQINDDKSPAEHHFLLSGTFNLGFIALHKGAETAAFLDWWEMRCLDSGFNEQRSGYFVDQKWINFIPCFYSSVHILKHLGCNMAYWNLHYRSLGSVNNYLYVNEKYPLIFFHFSGIEYEKKDGISKYQNRYDLNSRKDLREIFDAYRARLESNGIGKYQNKNYSFEKYSNGVYISELARKLFWANRELFCEEDPFSSNSAFYLWMNKINANGISKQYESINSTNVDRSNISFKCVNIIFRWILRIVGIEKYMMLLKYLSYIGITRNQKEIFKYC